MSLDTVDRTFADIAPLVRLVLVGVVVLLVVVACVCVCLYGCLCLPLTAIDLYDTMILADLLSHSSTASLLLLPLLFPSHSDPTADALSISQSHS